MATKAAATIPVSRIANQILLIRGHRILLDSDLAALYGVTTKRLNEQVKRNLDRFPGDFMFQLTSEEKAEVVAKCDHLKVKFSNKNPYAFTEHGAIMAASVLNSPQAIEVSVLVVRTFVKLRQMISTHKEFHHRLIELENRLDGHDETLRELVVAIRQLMDPPAPKKKNPIGFASWTEEKPVGKK